MPPPPTSSIPVSYDVLFELHSDLSAIWKQTNIPQRIYFPLRFFILFNFYSYKMTGKSFCFLHHILSSLTGHLFQLRNNVRRKSITNYELRNNVRHKSIRETEPLSFKAPLVAKHILSHTTLFLYFNNLMCNKGIRERGQMYSKATEGALKDKGFAFLKAAG